MNIFQIKYVKSSTEPFVRNMLSDKCCCLFEHPDQFIMALAQPMLWDRDWTLQL